MKHTDAGQTGQIALLMNPATHGGGDSRALNIKRIDTHGAIVVLAGDRAYKLKRAVRFPFLDYSTPELRRHFCNAEVTINRRTAPGLYIGVRPVLCGDNDTLRLGHETEIGTAIDWVIEMRRFADDALFDARARSGLLDEESLLILADQIAAFHRGAEPRVDHGGAEAMEGVLNTLAQSLHESNGALDPIRIAAFLNKARTHLSRCAALLDARRHAGLVRRGHGDMHLANICLWQGRPTLFDAIEFDDRIACIDVLYDLAFLLMDLLHRGMRRAANVVFNRYLMRAIVTDGIGTLSGLAALPLFLSLRAAIRARVGIAAAKAQMDSTQAESKRRECRAYLDQALEFLSPPTPRLIAVGGLSGTGKTTLALDLAPQVGADPGAVVLRSDVLRKARMKYDPFRRLPDAGYDTAVTHQVYDDLAQGADICLTAGHAAIADAVYLEEKQRRTIADRARHAGVAFTGLWLQAPRALIEDRIARRKADVSDATPKIVHMQAAHDPGPMDWIAVNAAGTREEVLHAARAAIERH